MPKKNKKSVVKPKKKAQRKKKITPKKKIKKIAAAKKPIRDEGLHRTKIRVIGIGGGGSAIAAEIAPIIKRVDFWVANTDVQALEKTGKNCRRFLFGQKITEGLGCGSDSRLGQLAAKQANDKIATLFQGVDFCILISCLGGGTGSGAIPEFAQKAKEAGCMTLGVFTLPFRFEGDKKMQSAKQALAKAIPFLSASVVFPNEKIFQVLDSQTGFQASLSAVNNILATDLKNLMETVYLPGLINIDFADLRAILEGEGKLAYLASASSDGDNRAENACKVLLAHPLNEYDARGADRILFNITSEKNISIAEVENISKTVSALNPRAKIIFGISQRTTPTHGLTITLLATGFAQAAKPPEKNQIRKAKKRKQALKSPIVQLVQAVLAQPEEKKKKHEKKDGKSQKKSGKEETVKNKETKNTNKKMEIKKIKAKKQKTTTSRKQNEMTKLDKAPREEVVAKMATADEKEIKQENNLFSKLRKNALDLRKEAELAEQEQLANERKWDVPAFLRRRV